MPKDDPLSLMASEARGGDIAEGGFRAQDHLTIARIPGWLAEDGFTDMIREAHGDAEASFHVPGVGLTREFVEYKDYEIQPSALRHEIDRFRRMGDQTGNAYRRFVMSSRGLSRDARPLHAALQRVRGALPFYVDVPAISGASYDDYEAAASKIGLDRADAKFIFDYVAFEPDAAPAETLAAALFEESMRRAFPATADASGRQMTMARQGLIDLVLSSKARPVARRQIVDAMAGGLPDLVASLRLAPIHLHTSIDESEQRKAGPIWMNWADFFGGNARRYPPPTEWDRRVVGELAAFRDWVMASGRSRSITLSGSRRLSTSLAIGRALSAVGGFSVTLEYRGMAWRTDSYASVEADAYRWHEDYLPSENSDCELVVGIGILNDVQPEASAYLDDAKLAGARLFLHSSVPLESAAHANSAVNSAKAAIQRALQRSGANHVRLFLATPAHFALFLGHRLNATAPVTCHERGEAGYVATCSC